MVETALNLSWVVIAVAALLFVPQRSRQARIALICALALLFPIISISDDLSADRETLERGAVAVLVELLVLLAIFNQLGQLETRRERRRATVVIGSSDPRSPPRA
jgi:hypothetical protein